MGIKHVNRKTYQGFIKSHNKRKSIGDVAEASTVALLQSKLVYFGLAVNEQNSK